MDTGDGAVDPQIRIAMQAQWRQGVGEVGNVGGVALWQQGEGRVDGGGDATWPGVGGRGVGVGGATAAAPWYLGGLRPRAIRGDGGHILGDGDGGVPTFEVGGGPSERERPAARPSFGDLYSSVHQFSMPTVGSLQHLRQWPQQTQERAATSQDSSPPPELLHTAHHSSPDDDDCQIRLEIPPRKKLRPPSSDPKLRGGRSIVESEKIAVMVASYHRHFGTYSNSRKQVSQLIPSLVWKLVYNDYLERFPNNQFLEDSLKERLRDTLKELKTGTSNDEDSDRAAIQPDDILEQLRGTDGHAARNILRARQAAIDRRSPSLGSTDTIHGEDALETHGSEPRPQSQGNGPRQPPTAGGGSRQPSPGPRQPAAALCSRQPSPAACSNRQFSGAAAAVRQPGMAAAAARSLGRQGQGSGGTGRSGSATTQAEKEKSLSKAEILAEQARGIVTIATSYKSGEGNRESFMVAKTDSARAKIDSEKMKGVFFSAKAKSVMLSDLFRLRDAGVYSDDEFRAESRRIMDSFENL